MLKNELENISESLALFNRETYLFYKRINIFGGYLYVLITKKVISVHLLNFNIITDHYCIQIRIFNSMNLNIVNI